MLTASATDESTALTKPAAIHARGGMADRVRSYDWSSTPLGALDTWSMTLASQVNLVLASPQPAILMWGSDLITFYNDAAIATMGEKHPAALGQSYRDIFAEVWRLVGPDVNACLTLGETSVHEDVRIPLVRDGEVQENYYTYCLVPVYEGDSIVGVYNPFIDVTQQRLNRLEKEAAAVAQNFLLKLTDMQRSASDGRQIMQISAELLGRHLNVGRVATRKPART